jgi:putative autoinducer-2 (AI-2) aldolase
VKTYYCEGFEAIVRATPVPLIIAGGKKTDERAAIELAANAMRSGAAGVDMGRNVFQSDCPVGMIRAVRAVVHDDAPVAAAYAIYEQEKSKGSP